jgi:putative endonuclease
MKKKFIYLYVLECKDKSLYTGIAKNLDQRILLHKAGKASKYTRSRGVKRLVYFEKCKSWSQALKREYAVKKLSRVHKLALVKT